MNVKFSFCLSHCCVPSNSERQSNYFSSQDKLFHGRRRHQYVCLCVLFDIFRFSFDFWSNETTRLETHTHSHTQAYARDVKIPLRWNSINQINQLHQKTSIQLQNFARVTSLTQTFVKSNETKKRKKIRSKRTDCDQRYRFQIELLKLILLTVLMTFSSIDWFFISFFVSSSTSQVFFKHITLSSVALTSTWTNHEF